MKNIWFLVFCFSFFFNCENSKSKSLNPLSLVPEDSEIIIKINSSEGLENGLKNNSLIKAIESYSQVKHLNTSLAPFYYVNKRHSLLAFSRSSNDSLEISYIVPFSKESISLDSISGLEIDSKFSSEKPIKKLMYNENIFYSTLVDSVLFVSNSLILTKNALIKPKVNTELESLYKLSNNEKMVSVFIDNTKKNTFPTQFKDSLLNSYQFTNYTVFDSDISQNSIFINGITKAKDSTKSLINIFKNTIPQENKIAYVLPNNVSSFTSVTFNDYEVIRANLIQHKLEDSLTNHSNIFQNVIEVGQFRNTSQKAIVLRSIDAASTLDNINSLTISDEYRGVNIFQIDDAMPFLNSFNPIITIESANHFINLDDFFIFSENIDFLQSIISNYQNNTVLSESDAYKNLMLDLSDESSLLLYGNASELNDILNTNFTDDKKLNISDYKSSSIQYIYDTDFAHVNAAIKTNKTRGKHNVVSEELNISLDSDLASAPQLVKNHTNNQMDIIVQDVNNNIHLISNKGKVFWKKQLDGKIMGDIKQIDIYKNGRLQLVFNTSKRLYILDRNGNDVKPFPLKFNDKITQPVSVFDYDKKKNYRLMITQGKSVLMYDKNGKIVSGFKYKSAKNEISSQPKHFRIARKDHIVFAHGNTLEILDRVGKTRIKVKENISFSGNEIYLYNNRFTTSNTNGELLEINQNGNVNHKNLNANDEHKITTTSKTLVVLNENKLTIKSKTIDLDYGDYTAPKIFYINDKIYVTITDLQSKKGYLFDSQAKPIANFPVYANSELTLNNIDKDKSLEVITKGDNDAIIIYKIQ
ncbi:ribonuclease HII [uncultured Psychroserpens sp.]|uniref:ribonuclease HII n=1 Tax=uncultured Psychroserpens sp. TaxID=255436 RepID=UPI002603E22A|nr:ribonuclease HII [uncultured Psychroserpens sp.]